MKLIDDRKWYAQAVTDLEHGNISQEQAREIISVLADARMLRMALADWSNHFMRIPEPGPDEPAQGFDPKVLTDFLSEH